MLLPHRSTTNAHVSNSTQFNSIVVVVVFVVVVVVIIIVVVIVIIIIVSTYCFCTFERIWSEFFPQSRGRWRLAQEIWHVENCAHVPYTHSDNKKVELEDLKTMFNLDFHLSTEFRLVAWEAHQFSVRIRAEMDF